jgi:hypothetical protein
MGSAKSGMSNGMGTDSSSGTMQKKAPVSNGTNPNGSNANPSGMQKSY